MFGNILKSFNRTLISALVSAALLALGHVCPTCTSYVDTQVVTDIVMAVVGYNGLHDLAVVVFGAVTAYLARREATVR
jgi:hypothetical protein